jgi:hypothetical protein
MSEEKKKETIFIIGCGTEGITDAVRKLALEKVGTDVILVDVDNTPAEKLKELGMPDQTEQSPFERPPIPIINPYADLPELKDVYISKKDSQPWRQRTPKPMKKRKRR